MRNLIRKWLGIPDIDITMYVKHAEIRTIVREVVSDMLRAEAETAIHSLFANNGGWYHDSLRDSTNSRINAVIKAAVVEHTQSHIDSTTKPESFVDDIVARIKNKQL